MKKSLLMICVAALAGLGLTAEAGDLPRAEYPRPQFERADWVNLNGEWTYTFDFFCFDDSPDYNLFTATWTGEMSLEGYYEGSAKMKGMDMKSVCTQGRPKMAKIQ